MFTTITTTVQSAIITVTQAVLKAIVKMTKVLLVQLFLQILLIMPGLLGASIDLLPNGGSPMRQVDVTSYHVIKDVESINSYFSLSENVIHVSDTTTQKEEIILGHEIGHKEQFDQLPTFWMFGATYYAIMKLVFPLVVIIVSCTSKKWVIQPIKWFLIIGWALTLSAEADASARALVFDPSLYNLAVLGLAFSSYLALCLIQCNVKEILRFASRKLKLT